MWLSLSFVSASSLKRQRLTQMSFINLRVNKELHEKRPRMWERSEVNGEKEKKKGQRAACPNQGNKHLEMQCEGH